MAVTKTRIVGRNITVTVTSNGVTRVSNWDKLSLDLPDDDFEATSASSLYKQFIDGQMGQAMLSVSGFLGADDYTGTMDLPANRDVVDNIVIGVGGDSLIGENLLAAGRGVWKVKNVKYDFEAGPAKYSFDIKSNYVE